MKYDLNVFMELWRGLDKGESVFITRSFLLSEYVHNGTGGWNKNTFIDRLKNETLWDSLLDDDRYAERIDLSKADLVLTDEDSRLKVEDKETKKKYHISNSENIIQLRSILNKRRINNSSKTQYLYVFTNTKPSCKLDIKTVRSINLDLEQLLQVHFRDLKSLLRLRFKDSVENNLMAELFFSKMDKRNCDEKLAIISEFLKLESENEIVATMKNKLIN